MENTMFVVHANNFLIFALPQDINKKILDSPQIKKGLYLVVEYISLFDNNTGFCVNFILKRGLSFF